MQIAILALLTAIDIVLRTNYMVTCDTQADAEKLIALVGKYHTGAIDAVNREKTVCFDALYVYSIGKTVKHFDHELGPGRIVEITVRGFYSRGKWTELPNVTRYTILNDRRMKA